MNTPYHEGELKIQQRAGEAERAVSTGRAVSSHIIKGAHEFIGQQAMAVMGSIDPDGMIWASVLFGAPGFMIANARQLVFDLGKMYRNPSDPFWANMVDSPRVGIVVIELSTRRRIRINGQIGQPGPGRMVLQVEEAYFNCPKYIQARRVVAMSPHENPSTVSTSHGAQLNAAQVALISQADTFFVASAHPTRGVDASHRGGNPGFVQVVDDVQLRIPDFVGNSMFNTLGNFASNPNAGLVFLDFEHNRILQLTGHAEVLWDVDASAQETGGTRRWWSFRVAQWLETRGAVPLQWVFVDYSAHNPPLVIG